MSTTECPACHQPWTPSPTPPKPKYGDRVRVKCGATGRYLGAYTGHTDLALFVSAQDNGLCIDAVDFDQTPADGLPVPSDHALAGCAEGIRYAHLREAAR